MSPSRHAAGAHRAPPARRLVLRAVFTAALFAIPLGASAQGETRYVTEELIVGVYSQPDLAGERVGQVRSADAVEVLASEGEAAQIRTGDGLEGWVKASYLQTETPLVTRFAALQADNDKLRKASASSAKVDAKALQKEISDLRAALDAANRRTAELEAPAAAPRERLADEEPVETVRPPRRDGLRTGVLLVLVGVLAAAAGFALGYRTLDRRIRAKYGGLKVY